MMPEPAPAPPRPDVRLITVSASYGAGGSVVAPAPARSETLRMYGTSMRENREIPRSPARPVTGRAAQGRPRPYA